MAGKRSPLLVIFFTVFIDMVGFGIVIPVLPLYAEGTRFGATAIQIGFLVGIYSFLQLICSPLFGKISDRVGRKPVLLVSVTGTCLGFLVMGAAGSLWMLFLARIIDGASGGNISTAQACIGSRCDATRATLEVDGTHWRGVRAGLCFRSCHWRRVEQVFALRAVLFRRPGWRFSIFCSLHSRLPETHGPEHRLQAHEKGAGSGMFSARWAMAR